ncbi:hypothetical protein [Flavobacterium sp. H122]|uniref:hypothetical protein n=1 Tax=Flavobacterium sp. H122 TaxID=2529860 RepID=UPI0010AA25DC|nr:hypothetical protein [Flavobacterium sp. H122]
MKIKPIQKLRSGALQFTVFISVLIALLLSGLILYAYTFTYFKEQSKATIDIIQLSESGINYILHHDIEFDTLEIEDLEANNRKVKVNLSNWGMFNKVTAIAFHRKKAFKRIALLGGLNDSEMASTLYLAESYNPLTIVGNTKIEGNVFLPSQGVKPGYIGGQSYYGSQLIYGKSSKSDLKLPEINTQSITTIDNYLNDLEPINAEEKNSIPNNQLHNSFKENTKYIISNNDIILNNIELIGNIIVKSARKITISKSTNIKDIILIAPEIVIEDDVKGTFQAIANKGILLGKNCKLNYPSALILWDNPKIAVMDKLEDKIKIDKNSQINGVVCYFNRDQKISNFNPRIILEEESKIKGQVYCQGSFELKGTVSGSVFTKEFVANQAGSTFVNHIYNGIIENNSIPKKYGGLLFEDNPKIIAKWMY